MEQYADHTFYTNNFKGNSISEAAFDYLAMKASNYIDHVTFGRISSLDSVPDEVKYAACAVAELMNIQSGSEGILQETVGKHTIHYEKKSTVEKNMYQAVALYLARTGLMYRGVKK